MQPKQDRMKLPVWAKLAMALVTLGLLGMGTIYLMGIVERGRWERYAATLREAGEPLTFKEIEARRADLPDERNSALVIEAALEEFPPDPNPSPSVLILGRWDPPPDLVEGIPQYVIDDSREFLEQHRPLLDALQPIMDMPVGRMTMAYTRNPFQMLLPELSSVRTASKLAALDAILQLVDGDPGGAVDATILQFRIAGSMNEHPTLIGNLVEMACGRLGLQTVEDVLRADEASEADLARLREAIATRRRANSLLWGMWSERAVPVEIYDLLASGELEVGDFSWGSAIPVPPSKLLPEFVIRKNQIRAVEMLTRLVEAGEDMVAMHEAALQLNTETVQLSQTYFIVKMLMPSLSRAVFLQVEHDTVLDCTLVGIAAERFRLATGRLPASLDELVPAYLDRVPLDPFAKGKPLKLIATDQGIVIYSIGEDTVDDGGEVVAEVSRPNAPDSGFRLLDIEHRRVVITDEPRPEDE